MSVRHQHTHLQTINIARQKHRCQAVAGFRRVQSCHSNRTSEWPHLKHQLCFLLLQLRALPLHHNAQQLVLQALRGNHTVQQGDLHATCSSEAALCIAQVLIGETSKLDRVFCLAAKPAGQKARLAVSSQLLLCRSL